MAGPNFDTTNVNLPPTMTLAGAVPTQPTVLLQQLITLVSATDPGYTANLPGTLIEDLASTATGAVAQMDQARVDYINSLSTTGASPAILNKLGQAVGIPRGGPSNTSAVVVFSGTPGFRVSAGFLVSDSSNRQYTVQDNTIIGTGGVSGNTNVVAVNSGSWAVPAGSITNLATSVPSNITLSVTNPNAGTPGVITGESDANYRARVQQANLAACTGTPRFVKTLLQNVPGVQSNLVAFQQSGSNWKCIVGGSGDPNAIANAIFSAVPDISVLTGSTVSPTRNVTVSINDYPDTYNITYVSPVAQSVAVAVTWNSVPTSLSTNAPVTTAAQAPIAAYINGIPVGQPINVYDIQAVFQAAVQNIIPLQFLSRMVFSVSINGTITPPVTGTGLIYGDSEGFFTTTASAITFTQG